MQLPSFSLVDWFAEAEGRFDISLSHSDCEPLSVSDILDDNAQQRLASYALGYGTFAGLDDLRIEVARQHERLSADDVIIFSGASEAIYTFMRANLSPGDEVIIQKPIFNSLRGIAQGIGCKLVDWSTTNEMTCEFDVSELAKLVTSKTKLIVFNFPHNPSGQMITVDELTTIIDVARKNDVMIFSDEQFRMLELPETQRLPSICELYEKGISISSVSKSYGMGGLRIGWLLSRDHDVIKRCREYRYYTTEMTNTPCQMLAVEALRNRDRILEANQSLIVRNSRSLRKFCEEHATWLTLHPPQAGTMALVEQKTSLSSKQFCRQLLEEQQVFLVPGELMGISDRLLRFGFGRADFTDGIERVGKFLNSANLTHSTARFSDKPSTKPDQIDFQPTDEEVAFVDSKLVEFNTEQANRYDFKPLRLVIRGTDGSVVAGLLATTGWDWLHVDILWVHAEHRRQGLGSKLLLAAEEKAVSRNCIGACLSTFSFQAPSFYEQHGYKSFGQIEDYPVNDKLFFYSKRLTLEAESI